MSFSELYKNISLKRYFCKLNKKSLHKYIFTYLKLYERIKMEDFKSFLEIVRYTLTTSGHILN